MKYVWMTLKIIFLIIGVTFTYLGAWSMLAKEFFEKKANG